MSKQIPPIATKKKKKKKREREREIPHAVMKIKDPACFN